MLQSCHCFKVWERDQKISISWIFNFIYLRFDINNSKINCGSLCFIRSQTFFIHSSINSSLKGLSWELWFRKPIILIVSSQDPQCASWNFPQKLLDLLILDIRNFPVLSLVESKVPWILIGCSLPQTTLFTGYRIKIKVKLQINKRFRSNIDLDTKIRVICNCKRKLKQSSIKKKKLHVQFTSLL